LRGARKAPAGSTRCAARLRHCASVGASHKLSSGGRRVVAQPPRRMHPRQGCPQRSGRKISRCAPAELDRLASTPRARSREERRLQPPSSKFDDADVHVWQTLVAMGAIYFCFMMIGAFRYRIPPAGWRPDGWAPPAASNAMISQHNVHLRDARCRDASLPEMRYFFPRMGLSLQINHERKSEFSA